MGLFDSRSLVSGFAGACALTILHEAQRRVLPDAPRVDVVGMRALAKLLTFAGLNAPQGTDLRRAGLAGDLGANTLFYSLVGAGSRPVLTGGLMGLGAGIAAVFTPGPLGLGRASTQRNARTAALTVALYSVAGLTAGAAYSALAQGEWPETDWGDVFFP